MRPPSHHSIFFSSLKQVEKRLKLENPSRPSTLSSTPPGETNHTPIESLSSTIYLNFDQPNGNSSNSNSSSLQDSEAPREFLSNSLDFPPTHEDPPPPETINDPQTINRVEINSVDEIELLIQLLGLSDCEEEEEEQNKVGFDLKNCGETFGYQCGFYAKMIGVKGPKCEREVVRLEGWIKQFLNDGEERRKEPLRLAHLLLGKAAFLSKCSDDFGRFEFPSTIEEFLQNDPPKD